jgi:hypothetical protein
MAAFGLTRGGCQLPGAVSMPPPSAFAGAGAVCTKLPAAAAADGYFFETGIGGDGDDADPVRWEVKVANGGGDDGTNRSGVRDAGNGTEWQSVGASAWELWYTGQLHLYPNLPYPTPRGGGARLEFAAAPGWAWCLVWLASQIVQLLCFAALAAVGAARREGWAHLILAGGYGLIAALNFTAALGFLASGRSREAAQYFASVVPGAVMSAGTAFAGRYILSVFAVAAVAFYAIQVLQGDGGGGGPPPNSHVKQWEGVKEKREPNEKKESGFWQKYHAGHRWCGAGMGWSGPGGE